MAVAVHRSESALHLGMPHTISRALSEVALLAHIAHLQWTEFGRLTGCPASRQVDAEGREVYASVYFVEVTGPADAGLGAFRPDDHVVIRSTLGRFGTTMLEGEHVIVPRDAAAPAIEVRLSNVLVALGAGPDDLRISTPVNATVEAVPTLPTRPESYRMIREAESTGCFFPPPEGTTSLCESEIAVPINPDRDLNGVGLLYFANYVAFLDAAERTALERAGIPAEALDRRATVRRRIGFYGNARPSDSLLIDVAAFRLDDVRLLVTHRVRRRSDGRRIAIASVEKRLASS